MSKAELVWAGGLAYVMVANVGPQAGGFEQG